MICHVIYQNYFDVNFSQASQKAFALASQASFDKGKRGSVTA